MMNLRFQIADLRFISFVDANRVAVRQIGDGSRFQTQHALVKLARPGEVGDGVATKGEFDDFEHKSIWLAI
jgi:hypothetical protein